MKTVIMDFLANGLNAGSFGSLNTSTGQTTYSRRPLTATDISNYKADVPEIKQEFYSIVKGWLAKGGFDFDPSLWSWYYRQPDQYRFQLWGRITWTDYDDIGATAFMHYIKLTGFLNVSYKIVKPYG